MNLLPAILLLAKMVIMTITSPVPPYDSVAQLDAVAHLINTTSPLDTFTATKDNIGFSTCIFDIHIYRECIQDSYRKYATIDRIYNEHGKPRSVRAGTPFPPTLRFFPEDEVWTVPSNMVNDNGVDIIIRGNQQDWSIEFEYGGCSWDENSNLKCAQCIREAEWIYDDPCDGNSSWLKDYNLHCGFQC